MNMRFSTFNNNQLTQFTIRPPTRSSSLGLNFPMVGRIYGSSGCSSCGGK